MVFFNWLCNIYDIMRLVLPSMDVCQKSWLIGRAKPSTDKT